VKKEHTQSSLTFELDLDRVKVNHHVRYLVQNLLSGHTDTQQSEQT